MKEFIVHDGKNLQAVEHLWMVVSEDEKGDGICCMSLFEGGPPVPLMTSVEKLIPGIIMAAKKMLKEIGSTKKLKLIKFNKAETVEYIRNKYEI